MKDESNVSASTKFVQVGNERYAYRRFGNGSGLPLLFLQHERLFASDVVSYADGGGALHVARRPVSGRERVVNYIKAVGPYLWSGMTLEWIEANGQTGVLMVRNGAAIGLATVEASEEGIFRILLFMRPSKVAAISRSIEAKRRLNPRLKHLLFEFS